MCNTFRKFATAEHLRGPAGFSTGMRGRSSGTDGVIKTAFGQRITGGLERAFDLRDPYKLNRAPLLRGGKQRLTSIGSIVCALLGVALLVGIGVFIGRELVRPPKRSWEGNIPLRIALFSHIYAQACM